MLELARAGRAVRLPLLRPRGAARGRVARCRASSSGTGWTAELVIMLEPTDNTIQAGCLGNLNARCIFHGDERALGAAVARRQRDHARGRSACAARAPRAARRRDPGARLSRGAQRDGDRRRDRDERDPCARDGDAQLPLRAGPRLRRRPRRACASSSTARRAAARSATRRRRASPLASPLVQALREARRLRARAEAGVDAGRRVLGAGPRRGQPRPRRDALRARAGRARRDRRRSAQTYDALEPFAATVLRDRLAVLEAMQTYPFVRLDEAKAAARARGIDLIDFGMGDPIEPTPRVHPAGARGGAAADGRISARAGPPGAARGDRRLARTPVRRRRRPGARADPDLRLEGGDLPLPARRVQRRRRTSSLIPEPAYPVYERGAAFAGARAALRAAASRRTRGCPTSTRSTTRRGSAARSSGSNYPHNPTGAVAPLSFFEELAERARDARLLPRVRRGVHRAVVRRAAGVRGAARRSEERRRVPDALEALVDDGLPHPGSSAREPALIDALRSFRPNAGTAPQEFVQRASVAAWNDEAHVVGDARALRAQARAPRAAARPRARLERRRRSISGSASRRASRRSRSRRGCSSTESSSRRARTSAPRARATRGSRSSRRSRSASARPRSCGGPVTVEETIAALDRGEIRVAEKRDGEWVVNEEAKAAILEYFRCARWSRRSSASSSTATRSRSSTATRQLGVRVVPPATARFGAVPLARRDPHAELREHRRVGRAADDGRHVGDGRLVRADRRRRPSRRRRRHRRRARAGRRAAGDRRGRRVRRLARSRRRGRDRRRAGGDRAAGRAQRDRADHRRDRAASPSSTAATCRRARSSSRARGRRSSRPARTSSPCALIIGQRKESTDLRTSLDAPVRRRAAAEPTGIRRSCSVRVCAGRARHARRARQPRAAAFESHAQIAAREGDDDLAVAVRRQRDGDGAGA